MSTFLSGEAPYSSAYMSARGNALCRCTAPWPGEDALESSLSTMHGQDGRSQGYLQHSILHNLGAAQARVPQAISSKRLHAPVMFALSITMTAMRAQLGFIPKMWQPSFPDVPQIPYTFAPRQTHGAPSKRHGRKGKAGNASSAAGATAPICAS